ncbi:MAG TPA: NmrA family NAD(P)-binding protein [Verrucomicrobiae bacterium]|nr:NmrA family NAD(P)-binding protein [Verrucomicrobiae bacterium]
MNIAVTGAFGYSGQYITRRLLQAGHQVFTLTNSPRRQNPFGDAVKAVPFRFDQPSKLKASLNGTEVLINTYWVRFDHRRFTHGEAVANSKALFHAAREAGVRRIIHVSITNPDINSNLPYFRGKAELELALKALGISHCILRPTVLFGKEDVLINNIAWALRHLPVFGLFGKGEYKLQPIFVDDLAAVAVKKAIGRESETLDAIGPETFSYRELVQAIRSALGLKRLIVGIPPALGYAMCRTLGMLLRDVVITREEIRGLMENRLWVNSQPLGSTKLTEWVGANRETLGIRYTSELGRRLDRLSNYK